MNVCANVLGDTGLLSISGQSISSYTYLSTHIFIYTFLSLSLSLCVYIYTYLHIYIYINMTFLRSMPHSMVAVMASGFLISIISLSP